MALKKRPGQGASDPTKPGPAPPPDRTPDLPSEPPADAGPVEGPPEASRPPVAGIGASAGGLDSLLKFVAAAPADCGVAFVLITHAAPQHEVQMAEPLARQTPMPVIEAADGMAVEANRVYVLPSNKSMTMSGGLLRLTEPVERGGPPSPIDLFLRSLAEDRQEKAIGIILSGAESHGTLGLRAIKAAGGMVMVQDPAPAEHRLMPQSAATGLADYVLPVEQLPEALVKYVRQVFAHSSKAGAAGPTSPDALSQVLEIVRAHTKFDFRPYRKTTLARRIDRRMRLSRFDRAVDYLAFLREHPDEVKGLSRELLIGVTSFFRDPEAWHALETAVIAPLVRAKGPAAPLRVWSVGCATGEEPYSVGMLLLEQLAVAQKQCPVQIFATDVDEDALEAARRGIYAESITADVSPERLARFFTRRDDSSYQVGKPLRETVTFARQNLLTDPPLCRLDLVVCRNLLIYLEREVQKRVMALLHFALAEGGVLFLGSSEAVGRDGHLFEPISAKRRIYRRIGATPMSALPFPVAEAEPRQAKAQPANRPQVPPRLAELAQNALLRRYGLAYAVINRGYEVLHAAGPIGGYLAQPDGPPTRNLRALARPGLEPRLHIAIQRAVRQNTAQSEKDVMMDHDGVHRRVNFDVEPLDRAIQTQGLLLISFLEPPNAGGETSAEAGARNRTADSVLVRRLEQELETTREDLRSSIQEMETSNEELQAANEEVMSMNEELQSTNEELETSKEALESLNEQLTTLNDELHEKVRELGSANNDMANLFNSTDVATVFLDRDFRIKRFTPAATRLFHLIATDVGRPIDHIAPRFADDDFLRDAERLLGDLTPREREVRTEDGRWYVRRIMPYRTVDNRIDGVVITFADVTERKKAADAVVRRLAAVVESAADAIVSKDLDGTIRTWNRGAERLYGYRPDEAVGRSVRMLVPDDRAEEWGRVMAQLARGEHVEQLETERVHKDGRRVAVALTISPIRDGDGKVVSASVTGRDVTDRKRAEEDLRRLTAELRARVEELTTLLDILPAGVLMADPECHRITANRAFYTMLGLPMGANLSLTAEQSDMPAGTRVYRGGRELPPGEFPMQVTGRTGRRIVDFDHDVVFPDGRVVTLLANTAPLLDGRGAIRGVVGSYTDITQRQRAAQALRDREERLQAILNTAADAIFTIDHRGIIQSVNAAAERMFGYAAAEMVGQNVTLLMPSPYREEHDGYLARYLQTGEKHIIGLSRETVARRKDGTVFPVDLAVSEIAHLKLFTGIHRDLTERKRLERAVVEIASGEQRRIGQDLHDTVAQELTALSLLGKDLAEIVGSDPPKAPLVERMNQGLQRSQRELRAVLRGLLPVAVDAGGLMASLADLAARTHQEGKVACTIECPVPVSVTDNLTATHLYLIAQEAVHNAVRHARARTVRIALRADGGLVLSVRDDGIGLPAESAPHQGMGLYIMRSRAAVIGARLSLEPAEPSGTVVTCVLARENSEPE